MSAAVASSDVVYIIVGMHRSGTSSIGRLMENIGFDFGDNLLEGMDSINDRGFWEDRDVVALNEHIFELYGSNWFDFERLPGKWWEDAKIKDLIGIAETWYQEGFSHEKPVAVKDPRFCRLLPFWKRVFLGMGVRPHILFVIRHPAEVAASLKRRDGFSLQVGYLLWLAYNIDALYYSRNLDLAIIDFETMLSKPENVASRLTMTDVASVHGLSEANLLALVKNNLDSESRHHKVADVLSHGEVQGDVQSMAHEFYDVMLHASPDEAKSIADKYRKRFYRLLDHHKEVLSALQATINNQVETNQKLSEIGDGHTYALSVIHDKDKQLEENKDFIAKCLAEIGNKESQLAITQQELERSQARVNEQVILNQKNNALWDRFEELQQIVHGRELKLSESLAYIEKCEAWIGEINLVSEDSQRILAEQRDYIARCEARIREQDQWLFDNTSYIAKCETRISDQDSGLAENRDYILRCETRLREQDDGLQRRDQLLGERLDRINSCETRVGELEQQLIQQHNEYSEKMDMIIREKTDLQGRCTELERQLQEQQAQYLESKNHLYKCEERIEEQNRVAEKQSLALHEAQRQIDLLQKNLSGSMAVIAEKDNILAEKAKSLEDCESEIDSRKAYIIDLERQISDLLQTKNRHEIEIAGYLVQNKTNSEQIHDLESVVTGLKSELDCLISDKEHLSAEISRARQLDSLNKQRIALQKKQIDTSKVHTAALESEIIALNAHNAGKQQELERYRSFRVVRLIDKFTDAD